MMNDLKVVFSRLGLDKGKYLVAFSGGPDSVYLLYVLASIYPDYSDRFFLCYINYHDSPDVIEEERIVNSYIKRYSVKLFKNEVTYDKSKNHNFEDWARNYRYQLFADIVNQNKLQGFLTAHQRNDLIETYLLQKQRNSHPLYWGLCDCSQYQDVPFYRPILSISRNQILETLRLNHLPYYDDITNQKTTRYLNFRKKEIPEEEKILQEIEERNHSLRLFYNNLKPSSSYSYSLYDSFSDEEKKRALVQLLDANQVGKDHPQRIGFMKKIYDFLKRRTNGTLLLDENSCLYKTRHGFFLHSDFANSRYEYPLKKGDRIDNPLFSLDFHNPASFNVKGNTALLRNYQKGDYLTTDLPTKDVYSLLRKQQVPAFLIPVYPVFVSEDRKILGVPFYKDIQEKKIPFSFHLPCLYNENDE